MKKPWQIWLLYGLCLLIVTPAMAWLSFKTMELDRIREDDRLQTELARREAELQERISSALWRMDGWLTPLVAQEAARPYYLYDSFYRVTAPASGQSAGKTKSPKQQSRQTTQFEQPSPLLFQPNEFVILHFEIGPDNQIRSPQRPQGSQQDQAITCGLTLAEVQFNDSKLNEVQSFCSYSNLIAQCPTLKLPNAHRSAVVTVDSASQSAVQTDDNALQAGQADSTQLAQTMYLDPKIAEIEKQLNQLSIGELADAQIKSQKPKQKIEVQRSRNLDRGNQEFVQRRKSAENYTRNQWLANNPLEPQGDPSSVDWAATVFVREGIMRPLWIGNKLVLARRVEAGEQEVVQCCWLDWEKIQIALQNEVSDLLPNVQFEAVRDAEDIRLGQALATLPVQLAVDITELTSALTLSDAGPKPLSSPSGLRMSLLIAWGGLAFAAVAGALLLHGVIRLSERRGAFVSAVTHELRTPLTTFCMYAEMLAENMVPSAEKRQQYAQTLKVEAERLSHLVENVLQFARLERGRSGDRHEPVSIDQLLDRFGDRLAARAAQSGMTFETEVEASSGDQVFHTDPAAIEQILFNLVDNACKYATSAKQKRIDFSGKITGNSLRLAVRDYGPGVNSDDRRRMFQPFRKSDQDAANTAQGVGLGLALCRRMAKSLGGTLSLADCSPGAEFVLEIPLKS